MKARFVWLTVIGLDVCLARLLHSGPASATDARKPQTSRATQEASAPQTKSTMADTPVELVGTVVAVNSESRTLVVDVPLGTETLRLGTEVSERTKISVGGAATSLEHLKEGDEVRIRYRRVDSGDKATSVEVLHGPLG